MQNKIYISPNQYIKIHSIYEFRFLFISLLKQAIFLPYSETKFMYLATFIRPFIFLFIFISIKNKFRNFIDESVPYEIYLYSGLVLWWYIVDSVKQSSVSFKYMRSLILKVYFPRIIVPVLPVFARLFDFIIHIFGLFILLFYVDVNLSFRPVLFLSSLLNLLILCISIGCFFSLLNLRYKLINSFIDYIFYFGFFLSPIFFTINLIPEKFHLAYFFMNPFASIFINLRASFIFEIEPIYPALFISLFVSFCFFFITYFFYSKQLDRLIETL